MGKSDAELSLTEKVKIDILASIQKGQYPEGSKIPTEKELCAHHGVSRITVQNAVRALVNEGVLYRVQGRGTFVSKRKINFHFLTRRTSFEEQILAMNMTPSVAVLQLEVTVASAAVAEQLRIAQGEKVIHLLRLRYADKEPISYVDCYQPYDLCHFLLDEDFTQESLFAALNKMPQTRIARVTRIVEVIAATHTEMLLLGVPKGSPIHVFSSYTQNEEGRIIDYGVTHSRGDRSKFAVELVPEGPFDWK